MIQHFAGKSTRQRETEPVGGRRLTSCLSRHWSDRSNPGRLDQQVRRVFHFSPLSNPFFPSALSNLLRRNLLAFCAISVTFGSAVPLLHLPSVVQLNDVYLCPTLFSSRSCNPETKCSPVSGCSDAISCHWFPETL